MQLFTVRCTNCGHCEKMDASGRLRFLQRHGHGRKIRDPNNEMVAALFDSMLSSLNCQNCSEPALQFSTQILSVSAEEEDDEFWGGARRCRSCNAAISKERLEALPAAVTCIACASAEVCASKCDVATQEHCPSCGGQLMYATSSTKSNTYQMRCTSCSYRGR